MPSANATSAFWLIADWALTAWKIMEVSKKITTHLQYPPSSHTGRVELTRLVEQNKQASFVLARSIRTSMKNPS